MVRALDLQSGDPEFKSRPDRWLDLFMVVPSSYPRPLQLNSRLVCLRPGGIHNLVMFIQHFHIDQNAPCLPPKFCITIVFNFSWDDCNTQKKLGTMVSAKFRGVKRGAL